MTKAIMAPPAPPMSAPTPTSIAVKAARSMPVRKVFMDSA
jgi:hypothetical protein